MDRVASDFEARLVVVGRFALAFVIRIFPWLRGIHRARTTAAPQWPKQPAGPDPDEPVSSL
ncbi:hypothetical protein NB311A_13356 [Nitrobacter sp. Nb-311A]|nr:hypothetical protein NB311A_13356 [Nitrobacter sp. Nb-311A]